MESSFPLAFRVKVSGKRDMRKCSQFSFLLLKPQKKELSCVNNLNRIEWCIMVGFLLPGGIMEGVYEIQFQILIALFDLVD